MTMKPASIPLLDPVLENELLTPSATNQETHYLRSVLSPDCTTCKNRFRDLISSFGHVIFKTIGQKVLFVQLQSFLCKADPSQRLKLISITRNVKEKLDFFIWETHKASEGA